MEALSSTGVAISLVSAFLILALIAELYYLLCWRRKKMHLLQEQQQHQLDGIDGTSPVKELLYLFCWKNPSLSSSTPLDPREIRANRVHSSASEEDEVCIDVELMKLHGLPGPPRFLFTIEEETETEDAKSRKSLQDYLAEAAASPPAAERDSDPLVAAATASFERSDGGGGGSPLPKMKFLRDAEEKLCRKNSQVNPLPSS